MPHTGFNNQIQARAIQSTDVDEHVNFKSCIRILKKKQRKTSFKIKKKHRDNTGRKDERCR